MIYLQLFWTFFKIGLFGFGGGYSMLSLIQFDLVEKQGWLTVSEFTDIVAISQITPGPIGINCATYSGYMTTGSVWGSVVATLAIMLPSFILMLIIAGMISKFKKNYWVESALKALRPAVVGLIAAAALLLMNEENFGPHLSNWISWVIFGCAFAGTYWLKINPILMILIAAGAGVLIYGVG